MSNPIVDSIISNLESGALDAAKQAGVATLADAKTAATDFLSLAIPTVERWVTLFTENPPLLTKDDLARLLEDLTFDLIVHSLTLGGMAEVEVDKTKNTILKIATGIVSGALGKMI